MISDALQQELFVNSPTFRRQVAGALTTVGIERWKLAVGTILTINAAEAAGATLTAEQLVGRQLAMTERQFLENALAVQGVNLGAAQPAVGLTLNGAPDPAREGITRLVNMLLASAGWTWTVSDWIAGQATASAEIGTQLNALLAGLVAAPVQGE
jgi:hypothetical protein